MQHMLVQGLVDKAILNSFLASDGMTSSSLRSYSLGHIYLYMMLQCFTFLAKSFQNCLCWGFQLEANFDCCTSHPMHQFCFRHLRKRPLKIKTILLDSKEKEAHHDKEKSALAFVFPESSAVNFTQRPCIRLLCTRKAFQNLEGEIKDNFLVW